MRIKTHVAFGAFAGLGLARWLPDAGVFAIGAFVGSFFPDFDLTSSWFGRKLPYGSWLTERIFGHRQLLHSIWVPVLALLALRWANFAVLGYGFLLGYVGHLALDSFTRKGISWLWPWLRVKGGLCTGRFEDTLLFVLFAGSALVLLIS